MESGEMDRKIGINGYNRQTESRWSGFAGGLQVGFGYDLRLQADDSLLMNLGGHVGWQTALDNGTSLGLDLLAAWRHELLDGNFSTTASFRDYGAYDFSSDSDLPGRDSLLVQAGLALATASDFSAQLEVGGEFFREGYTAMNVGLNRTWQF